ncbi:divalent cation tolerance protein CutA [Nostocoides sp. F2B08]|nr:divalent cation tolerance protein CutA [Tetrasphaera sp. F2B08]
MEIRIAAPDAEVADRIARHLVDARLAACVQQLPGLTSTYVWEGEVEQATEILLLVKTSTESFEAVCAAVTAIHPYDVPEILAVPVTAGLGSYERWVEESVGESVEHP